MTNSRKRGNAVEGEDWRKKRSWLQNDTLGLGSYDGI